MEEIIKEVLSTKDMQIYENVITLMSEQCDLYMNGAPRLELMKQIKSELGDCHYDSRMAGLHLGLIKQSNSPEDADLFWDDQAHKDLNIFDWQVLWGEMVRRNDKKIRKWFPDICENDYCYKIYDECLSFLDGGEKPFSSFGV